MLVNEKKLAFLLDDNFFDIVPEQNKNKFKM